MAGAGASQKLRKPSTVKILLSTRNAVMILVFLVHVLLSVRSLETSHQRRGRLCASAQQCSILCSSADVFNCALLTFLAKGLWGQLGCEGECPRVDTSQPFLLFWIAGLKKKWSIVIFVSKKLLRHNAAFGGANSCSWLMHRKEATSITFGLPPDGFRQKRNGSSLLSPAHLSKKSHPFSEGKCH